MARPAQPSPTPLRIPKPKAIVAARPVKKRQALKATNYPITTAQRKIAQNVKHGSLHKRPRMHDYCNACSYVPRFCTHVIVLYRSLPRLKYTTEQLAYLTYRRNGPLAIGNGTGACAVYNAGFSIKLGHSQTFSASSLTKLTNSYLLMTTEADVYTQTPLIRTPHIRARPSTGHPEHCVITSRVSSVVHVVRCLTPHKRRRLHHGSGRGQQ